jgi:ribosomal protein S5
LIDTKISDGSGGGHLARVTHAGELITVRGNYDSTFNAAMTSINTAYNLVGPKAGQQFIVTGVVLNADKNVSATDGAIAELYEATSDTTTTASKTLLTLNIGKNTTVPLTGILIQTTKGVYVNAKTDDATVNITLLGYYLEIDEAHN